MDNLAPSIPSGFSFITDTVLTWEASADEDFNFFTVYGSAVDYLDEAAVVVGYTVDTAMDVSGQSFAYFLLTVTDLAGNEGEEAVVDVSTSVLGAIPSRCVLYHNVPNPFNPMTIIRYSIPDARLVRISIFMVDGRRVKTLVNEQVSAGYQEIVWNGHDEDGRAVPSGTYFYRLEAGGYVETKRMTLIR